MGPIIEDRRRYINEYGKNWDKKPVRSSVSSLQNCDLIAAIFQNDMLSWLMDEASPVEMSTRNLTLRIMSINFAAIHTSSTVRFFFT